MIVSYLRCDHTGLGWVPDPVRQSFFKRENSAERPTYRIRWCTNEGSNRNEATKVKELSKMVRKPQKLGDRFATYSPSLISDGVQNHQYFDLKCLPSRTQRGLTHVLYATQFISHRYGSPRKLIEMVWNIK